MSVTDTIRWDVARLRASNEDYTFFVFRNLFIHNSSNINNPHLLDRLADLLEANTDVRFFRPGIYYLIHTTHDNMSLCFIGRHVKEQELHHLSAVFLNNRNLNFLQLHGAEYLFDRSQPTRNVSLSLTRTMFLKSIFSTHPTLKRLRLEFSKRCSLQDTHIRLITETLRTNTSLRELELPGLSLRDRGAAMLAEVVACSNSTLKWLDLSRNKISDDGAAALAKALCYNKSLEVLLLGHNRIGPEGAHAIALSLKKNRSLKRLGLHANNLGDEGVMFLAEALHKHASTGLGLFLTVPSRFWRQQPRQPNVAHSSQQNQSLRELYLGSNSIGDRGCKALALALRNNHSLCRLCLGNNRDITVAGAKAFIYAMTKNHHTNRNHTLQALNIPCKDKTLRAHLSHMCEQNRNVETTTVRLTISIESLPPYLYADALGVISSSPTSLYSVLRANMSIFTEGERGIPYV